MDERAKYFSRKFIRNGIAGILISALLIYNAIVKIEPSNVTLFIFPVLSLVWLYFGLMINKKLKTKNATNSIPEISDERITFRQIEFVFTILIFGILFAYLKHLSYAGYLIAAVLIAYIWWLYSQIKLLNNYFKD